MTIHDLRQEYAKVRARSHALTQGEFNEAVRRLVADEYRATRAPVTPERWVALAKSARFDCRACNGTGQFLRDGEPDGGECYRCGGRGAQNDADALRNWGYDRYRYGRCDDQHEEV